MNDVFYAVHAEMLQGERLEREFRESCKGACEERTSWRIFIIKISYQETTSDSRLKRLSVLL
jgi:hypothetical protein